MLFIKCVHRKGVYGVTIHLGRDRHVAAQLTHAFQIVVAVVVCPGCAFLCQRGAAQQAKRKQQREEKLCSFHVLSFLSMNHWENLCRFDAGLAGFKGLMGIHAQGANGGKPVAIIFHCPKRRIQKR